MSFIFKQEVVAGSHGNRDRLAVVPVSPWVLHKAFNMPVDSEILSAYYDESTQTVNLIVAYDKVPQLRPGQPLPRATLIIHTRESEIKL